MTCGGCAASIEKVLGKLGGKRNSIIHRFYYPLIDGLFTADKVEKVDIDVDKKTVLVTSNLTSDVLLETIKKTGKTTEYVGVKK